MLDIVVGKISQMLASLRIGNFEHNTRIGGLIMLELFIGSRSSEFLSVPPFRYIQNDPSPQIRGNSGSPDSNLLFLMPMSGRRKYEDAKIHIVGLRYERSIGMCKEAADSNIVLIFVLPKRRLPE